MSRVSLKIVGASGQGINSIGEILAKSLKRSGYCVFGYREYPSLIKGGHASYQLDVSEEEIKSSERKVDILVTLNHHGLQKNLIDLKDGGVVIHAVRQWKFSPAETQTITERKLKVVCLPVDEILVRLKAKPILGNVLIAAFVWAALGRDITTLKELVTEKFAKKKDLLDLNMRCIDEGYRFSDPEGGTISVALPASQDKWKNHLLLTGSNAIGLGAVHAGVRLYAGYPMTPSSPILSYIAELQNKTGMVIKQAEDEITAAQMVSGAMFMGTRALTATSGGGFDLMSETVSLNGLIENPTVFILAQRPGPATGLPTWTAQGDLLMAVHTAHGEFVRCVMSVSDSADAFRLMPEAFNLAEEFQITVIVLTDKQIGEALYTQASYDQSGTEIRRGELVTDPIQLAQLKGTDRYASMAEHGVSQRWLPGAKAETFAMQGDEHNGDGTVDESAENARQQMEKRMRKIEALSAKLPEPELFGSEDPDILLVGWGSTKSPILDALKSPRLQGKKISYLHFTYLWPLKIERFSFLARKAKTIALIEGNYQGQLGMLLRQQTGIEIKHRILKYDGRPFFVDEIIERIEPLLTQKGSVAVPRKRSRLLSR